MRARANLFVLVAGASLAGCSQGDGAPGAARQLSAAPQPIAVTTVAAAPQPMPRYAVLTGSLVADRESDVAADVSGKLLQVPVERGMRVTAGAVLAVLDRRSASIGSREAAANVDLARGQAALARLDCERADGLLQSGAIGKAEYDRIRAQCQATLLTVEAARARQDAALQALGDAVIRAPFAGVISERYVNVGEFVKPDSRIVHLVASDPVRLALPIPEYALALVREGMQVQVRVPAYPERWFEGAVRHLGAALRASTRDLLVEAIVANPGDELRPGMFAVVRVVLPKQDAIAIPDAAVRTVGGVARAFVASRGEASERILELGARIPGFIEVRKGIAAGELVISPLPSAVADGTALSP